MHSESLSSVCSLSILAKVHNREHRLGVRKIDALEQFFYLDVVMIFAAAAADAVLSVLNFVRWPKI